MSPRRAILVVSGACVLAGALGAIHAFSVFVPDLEARFGASRGMVSLTYGVALASLTAAVLFGPRLFAKAAPAVLVLLIGALASIGALFAGVAPGLWAVWLGFGVCFGFANGLGYGFGLQLAGRYAPGREGLAMGAVTASYALGAALGAPLFTSALTMGLTAGMFALAALVAIAAPIAATLIWRAGAKWEDPTTGATGEKAAPVLRLWIGYGAGAAAGLMTIGHAAPLAASMGLEDVWRAPAVIALANLCGSLTGGALADRTSPGFALTAPPALAALAMLGLIGGGASLVFPVLALIGFSYGALIAIYPAVIAKRTGEASAATYGRVFTAWGLAGLAAPAAAGATFEATEGYAAALWLAALLAMASAVVGAAAMRRAG